MPECFREAAKYSWSDRDSDFPRKLIGVMDAQLGRVRVSDVMLDIPEGKR